MTQIDIDAIVDELKKLALSFSVQILSNAEIERVHANANYGDMSKREVVNNGVWHVLMDYHIGATTRQIIIELGLAVADENPHLPVRLTDKGRKYAVALYPSLDNKFNPQAITSLITAYEAIKVENKKITTLLKMLIPSPYHAGRDGPCCYELQTISNGEPRWLNVGCTCGNYDDAQSAGEWASEMNKQLVFEALAKEIGFDIAILKKGITHE